MNKNFFIFILIIIVLFTACSPNLVNSNIKIEVSITPTKHKTEIPATSTLIPTEVPPTLTPTTTPTITPTPTPSNHFRYIIQSGDTASAISKRFDVSWDEVIGADNLSEIFFLEAGIELYIPINIQIPFEMPKLIPDVEYLYSLTAKEKDIYELVENFDGYLNSYTEWFINYGLLTGIDLISNISRDNSINPKLTLALLQFESNWVEGVEIPEEALLYPLGIEEGLQHNLFTQLGLAIDKLVMGYYGWRDGSLTNLHFLDGTNIRLDPNLNAGSVGIMYYFSENHTQEEWKEIIYGENGYMSLYLNWYGDPWINELSTTAHIPSGLEQPDLILPFLRNQRWALTGGPHGAWRADSPWAGLDFAPGLGEPGCKEPYGVNVLASASGVIARKSLGVIVLDLDGDGDENTGWSLVYLHLNETDHLEVGDSVDVTDKIGIPSCLGGRTTGIHIHLSRKFNGEWMLADGPVPFNLGGWVALQGEYPYDGFLIRGDETVTAYESATEITYIKRLSDDP